VTPIFTGQVVANEVIMSRALNRTKTALLIEGDKDRRVYRRVTDPTCCQLFGAGNRDHAIAALGILKAHHQPGVLAVVDADTDHLAGKLHTDPDLIVTPTRDCEGMLLSSHALRTVPAEFDLDDDAFGPDPERAAFEAAVPLAYVRYAAERRGWQVRASAIDVSAFIEMSALKCDCAALCNHIAGLTLTPGVTAADYAAELKALSAIGRDPVEVARGHDVTSILAWAIQKRRRKKRKHGSLISAEIIESFLRAAYPDEAFADTKLFKAIDSWERRNAPFKVLKR
jgi:hypothetical protein